MRIVGVIASTLVAGVVLVICTVAVNMTAAEVQARLDGVCFLLLRLARRLLPTDLRVPLHDEEWVPELHHILSREEARPITRLAQGLAYSLDLLFHIGAVATEVDASRSVPDTKEKARSPTPSGTPSTATLIYVGIALLAIIVVLVLTTAPLFLLLELAVVLTVLLGPRMRAKRRYAADIFDRTREITRDEEYEADIARDRRRIFMVLPTVLRRVVLPARRVNIREPVRASKYVRVEFGRVDFESIFTRPLAVWLPQREDITRVIRRWSPLFDPQGSPSGQEDLEQLHRQVGVVFGYVDARDLTRDEWDELRRDVANGSKPSELLDPWRELTLEELERRVRVAELNHEWCVAWVPQM